MKESVTLGGNSIVLLSFVCSSSQFKHIDFDYLILILYMRFAISLCLSRSNFFFIVKRSSINASIPFFSVISIGILAYIINCITRRFDNVLFDQDVIKDLLIFFNNSNQLSPIEMCQGRTCEKEKDYSSFIEHSAYEDR